MDACNACELHNAAEAECSQWQDIMRLDATAEFDLPCMYASVACVTVLVGKSKHMSAICAHVCQHGQPVVKRLHLVGSPAVHAPVCEPAAAAECCQLWKLFPGDLDEGRLPCTVTHGPEHQVGLSASSAEAPLCQFSLHLHIPST
jgi:hypothetical protein